MPLSAAACYLPGRVDALHAPLEGLLIYWQAGHLTKLCTKASWLSRFSSLKMAGVEMTSWTRRWILSGVSCSWWSDVCVQNGGLCGSHCQRGEEIVQYRSTIMSFILLACTCFYVVNVWKCMPSMILIGVLLGGYLFWNFPRFGAQLGRAQRQRQSPAKAKRRWHGLSWFLNQRPCTIID